MNNVQTFLDNYGDKLPLAVDWVNKLLRHHAPLMKSINTFGFKRLPNYFHNSHLDKVNVVLVDEVPAMPVYSEWGIEPLKEFELNNKGQWAGEAYGDTIFIRKDCIENEGLIMHEVVHTVQYKLMGVSHFLLAYGYECAVVEYPNGPLEQMARQLEDAFRKSANIFNVEDILRPEISKLENLLFSGIK